MPRKSFQPSRLLRLATARANLLFDGACALVVMLLTFAILNSGRMPDGFEGFLSERLSVRNLALLVAFVAIWIGCFAVAGLYRTEPPGTSVASTTVRVAAASTMATLLLSVFVLASRSGAFNLRVLVFFWGASVLAEIAGRTLIAALADWLERRAQVVRQTLIVGSGRRALTLSQNLEGRHARGCELVGFVDTRAVEEVEPAIRDRLIGTLEGLEALLCARPIDQVLVALPVKSCYAAIESVLETCERIGVEVTYFPDIFATRRARAFEEDDELPAVRHLPAADDHRLVIKRVIDVVGAICGLVVLAPVLLVCAIAIKLTSPGPILFTQLRYGYNRRQFRMHKFRTMVVDAERQQAALEKLNEAQGPVFKIRADPRITRCGRVMRKLSLDELPQLFDVLRGDMSLVGPRPLPARDVRRFNETWLMRRFSVKPGLTCLWQVNGRSDTQFDQWVKLDLAYIDNWSLALDMQILIKTVPVVLAGTGAM